MISPQGQTIRMTLQIVRDWVNRRLCAPGFVGVVAGSNLLREDFGDPYGHPVAVARY
ncbi:hypothetical protein HNQ99_000865 [Rhizorhapis suberifaciens]|uniref:Uncharacterized protein n=1 Tax=Rhizorhapis suberifaciens TaxID=13656 RepID=A0A840HR54_9SPHN|nr:hypothetical protein [Rhizorhapis suberifaciens]